MNCYNEAILNERKKRGVLQVLTHAFSKRTPFLATPEGKLAFYRDHFIELRMEHDGLVTSGIQINTLGFKKENPS